MIGSVETITTPVDPHGRHLLACHFTHFSAITADQLKQIASACSTLLKSLIPFTIEKAQKWYFT